MANEIWKRMDGDTNKSYQAFCVYRNLGEGRTLEEATKQFYYNTKESHKPPNELKGFQSKFRQMRKWSAENNWINRVSAYDDYLDEQARTDIEEERREAMEIQKKIARVALKKGFRPGKVGKPIIF